MLVWVIVDLASEVVKKLDEGNRARGRAALRSGVGVALLVVCRTVGVEKLRKCGAADTGEEVCPATGGVGGGVQGKQLLRRRLRHGV